MTVTADQAQMLTALAIACRPHRAPTWDAPGVIAQLRKVHGLDLAEVAMATIRLARDPHAKTPADIANTRAECWREALKPPKWTTTAAPIGARCTTCGQVELDCASRWALTGDQGRDDAQGRHRFTRPHARDVDLTPVVAELKGHLEPTRPPAEPRPVVRDPRVGEVREHLAEGVQA